MKKVTALILGLVMLFSFAACSGSSNEEVTAQPGSSSTPGQNAVSGESVRVLRVGTTEASNGFLPWTGNMNVLGSYLLFDAVAVRLGDGSLVPQAAESWEWLDDLTLRIKLRDDVYFNNGKQCLGEDVVYAFWQMATSPEGVQNSYFNSIDFDNTTVSDDGLTVTLKLKNAFAPLNSILDVPLLVDKSEVENWTNDDERWWDAPVSSGPYEVVENVAGSHTTYKLRGDYWNAEFTPDWDEIIVNYYTNQTAMFVAFENNEIDLALNVNQNDYARLLSGDVKDAETAGYQLIATNSALIFCMSPYKTEFQDAKVREAIANALNGEEIGLVNYGNMYLPVDSVIGSKTQYYVPAGTYDGGIEYAKQCMAESAYPDGFTINVVGVNTEKGLWEVIQAQLAELNITLNLQTFDFATCMPLYMQEGSSDLMIMYVLGGNPTFDPFVDTSPLVVNGPLAPARVLDADYNEWIASGATTTDSAKRADYYAKAQQWLYDNFQCIPLLEPCYAMAYRNNVVGETVLHSATRVNLALLPAA
ncbi:MAG: ABC transporter substrate-binding protein [Oscillospiraceae bacterium]|jgi:peptide/nickel transport system substrate-binding protein